MQTGAEAAGRVATEVAGASLESLEIRNFRNFAELRCELPEAGCAIVGPNGSGKTNLLEAIYYLEVFRSFRGARDAELVRFGEDVFRIEGRLREGDADRLAAAYERSGRRKKVERDGAAVDRLGDALGTLGAVVFHLEDAELVCGSPGRRRRFLDILLSLARPGYLAALQRFRAALGQRNEALREGTPRDVLGAWTEGLVGPAARVMAERAAWVAERAGDFGRYHAAIAGGAPGGLRYEPALGPRDGSERPADAEAAEWAQRLRRALAATAERERRRGATVVGPHRDDLAITAGVDDGGTLRDLRRYGSGGQQRTAAIALRLAEADTLRDRGRRDPVYLLDDVFAELDRERSERVVRLLEEGRSGQVILTAPKPSDLPLRGGRLARWRIRDGRLRTDG